MLYFSEHSPTVYSLGIYSLGQPTLLWISQITNLQPGLRVYSLGIYTLGQPILDLSEHSPTTAWRSTVWGSTVSCSRCWISQSTHLQPEGILYGGLRSGVLHSRATDCGSLRALIYSSGVYSLGVDSLGQQILDLSEHSPTALDLQSSLGVYSLRQPILDLSEHSSTAWGSAVWGSTVWGYTVSGNRFWISQSTHLQPGRTIDFDI